MSATYFKSGRSVRLEIAAGRESLLGIDERGTAVTEGDVFRASPSDALERLAPISEEPVTRLWVSLVSGIPPSVDVERAVMVEGSSRQRVTRDGETREWDERSVRLFVSLVNRSARCRVQLQLGAEDAAEIDLEPLEQAASALAGLADQPPPSGRILLRPAVTAGLWPFLLGRSGRLRIGQSSHPHLQIDGAGIPIVPHAGAPWPNVFRPSYRIPPVPAPFHLAAEPFGEVPDAEGEAVAVALIGAPVAAAGRIEAGLLCRSRDASFVRQAAFDAVEWRRRIAAAGPPTRWYPVGAGSWGCDAVLEVE